MSNSKHSTWKDLKRAIEKERATEDDFKSAVTKTNTIRRELHSKGYIKRKTKHLRKIRKNNSEYSNIPNNKFHNYEVMPKEREYEIIIESEESVYYPLDKEDILQILNKIPASFTYLLKSIRHTFRTKDPLELIELFPGVWTTGRLGTAYLYRNKIELFGYKIKLQNLSFIEPLLFYLKVVSMGTLVHEIGHHYDFTLKYARKGQFKGTVELGEEEYAQYVERDYYLKVVCPYIKERYSSDIEKFNCWMKEIGCLPLNIMYFDPGLKKSIDYFLLDEFFCGLNNSKDTDYLNLAIAKSLHHGGEIMIALQYIDFILSRNQEYLEALRLKAHILFHEENNSTEAEKIYENLIVMIPDDPGVYFDYAILKYSLKDKEKAEELSCIALTLGVGRDDIPVLNMNCSSNR